jgi:hypothetical protein
MTERDLYPEISYVQLHEGVLEREADPAVESG